MLNITRQIKICFPFMEEIESKDRYRELGKREWKIDKGRKRDLRERKMCIMLCVFMGI